MATVKLRDPAQPISFDLSFESPHAVFYRLWYREPGDERFTILASGSDDAAANPSGHTHTAGPLPRGTRFAYFFHFIGNLNTAFRARLRLLQDGEELDGGSITVSGTIPDRGHASRSGERELV